MKLPEAVDLPKAPLCGQTFYLDRPLVGGRVFDLFVPEKLPIKAALFFIHGGGWRGGSRSIFHAIIQALSGYGIACATTDYRLNGATITDQLEDVRLAYAHFLNDLNKHQYQTSPVVMGSSAGAHLALLLSLAKPGACSEKLPQDSALKNLTYQKPSGLVAVSAPVTFQPWDEIFPAIWTEMQRAVGISYKYNPQAYQLVSPVNHIDSQSPPVLFMQGENEHMFPDALIEQFIQKASAAGVRAKMIQYQNAEHGFFYDTTRPCQQRALKDLVGFIESCCGAAQ